MVTRDAKFSGSPRGAGFMGLASQLLEPEQEETPRLRVPGKWGSIKATIRGAEWEWGGGGGEKGQRKAGRAGLEVRGLGCHAEECGQRKDTVEMASAGA